ncbi:MAG TPA: hypothetical protein EYQ83_08290, partial [Acidobacteria bacterium]|nr:hypothetical protein [Acidobacteriota bacterium]
MWATVFAVAAGVPAVADAQTASRVDGKPNLQGVWDFRTLTPLQRPSDRVDQAQLTPEEIAEIEQDRTTNWTLLKKNAEQFIESYNVTEPNLRDDGEIRYYQIAANKALGNALHVQRDMQVLLDNESIPPEFQQAWLSTRVRVM